MIMRVRMEQNKGKIEYAFAFSILGLIEDQEFKTKSENWE